VRVVGFNPGLARAHFNRGLVKMKKLARVVGVYYSIDSDFMVDLEVIIESKLQTIHIHGESLEELGAVISLGSGWHIEDIRGCNVWLYYKGKNIMAVSHSDGAKRIKCKNVSEKD